MATTGQTLITELARRVRDDSNTAHARDLLRRILSQAQRVVNYQQQSRKVTTTFTPSAGRVLYRRSEIAANVAIVNRIRQGSRDLDHVPWHALVHGDPRWLRATGSRYAYFSRIGGSLFALMPALDVPETVEVTYTAVPTDLVDSSTNVDLPDELLPLVMDLAELVVLCKGRLFDSMPDPAQRIADLLKSLTANIAPYRSAG